MASLQVEEMTLLLAEVHIQLLKALLKKEVEDDQQTVYQRDSINSILMFGNTITWPEAMRTYFQTDTIFAPALSLLESFEYPFTTADVRPSIPIFITDQILCRETTKSSATVKFITTSKYFCDFLQNFFIYIFFLQESSALIVEFVTQLEMYSVVRPAQLSTSSSV